MRVVISDATLRRHRACPARFQADCPWWDPKENALVYPNWGSEVIDHYLTARQGGAAMLEWLVRHELVPMTMDEFKAAVVARGGSNG